MTYRPLTIREAEFIAHRFAIETMNSNDEPIPDFFTRSPGKLESCLAEPFQSIGGKFARYYFAERVAVLFYLVTKNHCFSNGNKRMAVTITLAFCFVNNRWINVDPYALYGIANMVAESHPNNKPVLIKALTTFFNIHLIKPKK